MKGWHKYIHYPGWNPIHWNDSRENLEGCHRVYCFRSTGICKIFVNIVEYRGLGVNSKVIESQENDGIVLGGFLNDTGGDDDEVIR